VPAAACAVLCGLGLGGFRALVHLARSLGLAIKTLQPSRVR